MLPHVAPAEEPAETAAVEDYDNIDEALDNLDFDPTNIAFAGTWQGYYQGIYRANVAINNIPEVENIDPQLQRRLIAENRFLRAYYYFFLVRAFGGVETIAPLGQGTIHVGQAYGIEAAHDYRPGVLVHRYRRVMTVAAADGYLVVTRWSPVSLDAARNFGR